jgi:hypothetical protein
MDIDGQLRPMQTLSIINVLHGIGRFGMNMLTLGLMLMMVASIETSVANAAASKSIAAFCKTNPDADFPARTFYGQKYHPGIIPPEAAAVGATNWRCMNGKVYVCARDASGASCWKMNASRMPSKDVQETCEENPGQGFVAMAVIGNSASTWRCNGPTPEIIKTVPLDRRGFMLGTWAPLFDVHGKINQHIKLNSDPR